MNNEVTCNDIRMEKAIETSIGSTCSRRKVGAVIYNGSTYLGKGANKTNDREQCRNCYRSANNIPSGYELDKCYAVHAEQRAILDAIANEKFNELKGSTLYVTTFPCVTCMKLLIEVGVTTIVYHTEYNSEMAKKLAKKHNVILIEYDNYRDQRLSNEGLFGELDGEEVSDDGEN